MTTSYLNQGKHLLNRDKTQEEEERNTPTPLQPEIKLKSVHDAVSSDSS